MLNDPLNTRNRKIPEVYFPTPKRKQLSELEVRTKSAATEMGHRSRIQPNLSISKRIGFIYYFSFFLITEMFLIERPGLIF
jgi:hypothetical protein